MTEEQSKHRSDFLPLFFTIDILKTFADKVPGIWH